MFFSGTYVPSTMDFPQTNGDKSNGSGGFGFSNPYEGITLHILFQEKEHIKEPERDWVCRLRPIDFFLQFK